MQQFQQKQTRNRIQENRKHIYLGNIYRAVYSLQTGANEEIKHTWGNKGTNDHRNYKELQTRTGDGKLGENYSIKKSKHKMKT